MKNKKIKRLPSVRMISMVLDGKEKGWDKYYYFYDRLFRKMLSDSFKQSGVLLNPDETDEMMQLFWIGMVTAIRGYKIQDEADFIISDVESSFL